MHLNASRDDHAMITLLRDNTEICPRHSMAIYGNVHFWGSSVLQYAVAWYKEDWTWCIQTSTGSR